jgi:hypothetical protein
MRRLTSLLRLVALVVTATSAHAQPPEPRPPSPLQGFGAARRIVGTSTTRHFEMKGAPGAIVDTSTLVFPGGSAGTEFTIDFVVQYEGPRPKTPPSVVDVVITQYVSSDEHPDMSMQADGQAVDMNPRLRSRRSVVASIPFDEFAKLANADAIVERAFDTELEFGAGQRRMLHAVAQRWSGM